MAPPAGTLRVGRYFLALLAILAVLYSIVFWPGQRHTPKLGLDLSGGQQVILTAKTPNNKTPSSSQMSQAKQILENRVNGTGVTQATVVIQGNNQIVISIPGSSSVDAQSLLQQAVLTMRGAVMPPVPLACVTPTVSASGTPSVASPTSTGSRSSGSTSSGATAAGTTTAAANGFAQSPLAASTPKPSPAATNTTKSTLTGGSTPTAGSSASPSPSATPTSTPPPPPCVTKPLSGLTFAIPTTEAAYGALSTANRRALQTAVARTNCNTASSQLATAPSYVACDDGSSFGAPVVYLLGPAIVQGRQIAGASSQAPNPSNGQTQWTVNLDLKSSGQAAWSSYTGAHNLGSNHSTANALQCSTTAVPCADFVGFVLDGKVISAPVNESAINGQTTQISGNFTQSSANKLANELKYGALPLSFTAQAIETVSATLGTSQLQAGLLAGGIGLILVVLYSLIYYRALGLVTIASLLVSGALTYGSLVMLGTQIDFTLSLAGIAGFIVAIGITADSFVVFFERMKDEVHEGRSARVAIPRAWIRARRTILSADTVSFLAAAILYYFAAGDVKGFAFTLGLSTILDLVVVFLFTHPLVSLLSRLRSFGSSRFTGLDAVREGGMSAGPGAVGQGRKARRDKATSADGSSRGRPGKGANPASASIVGGSVAVLEDPADVGSDGHDIGSPVGDIGSASGDASSAAPAKIAAHPEEELPVAADDAEPDRQALPESGQGPAAPVPAAGTAAERAAARRARMREEKGER
ncbi:MAG: protein translocase subunit SecD [Actinomycetota bacterium]|nr:protein translocase subunit SecD [Actinomycetota bacterium]